MKTVEVPSAVELVAGSNSRVYPFSEFLAAALDGHAPLGKGLKMIRTAVKLHDKIEEYNGSSEMQFETTDFEVIKAAVEAFGMNPAIARQVCVYFEAIENAKET